MKIPAVLSALKESFHSGMETMNKNARKMEMVGSELHAIGGHMKNIGRILIGRERKEPDQQNPDKGNLAKVQKAFLTCGRCFAEMEKQTENTLKQVEQFRNGGEKKLFFDWGNNGSVDHVGIVESVADGRVNTIEGNSGNKCTRRSYAIGDSRIYGYGIPIY